MSWSPRTRSWRSRRRRSWDPETRIWYPRMTSRMSRRKRSHNSSRKSQSPKRRSSRPRRRSQRSKRRKRRRQRKTTSRSQRRRRIRIPRRTRTARIPSNPAKRHSSAIIVTLCCRQRRKSAPHAAHASSGAKTALLQCSPQKTVLAAILGGTTATGKLAMTATRCAILMLLVPTAKGAQRRMMFRWRLKSRRMKGGRRTIRPS